MIPVPEKSMSREERVKPSEGGTLGYEGLAARKPRNKVSRPEGSGIEERGHQELCERPSKKPPEQLWAKVKQQTKRPQRCHIRGIYTNYRLLYR